MPRIENKHRQERRALGTSPLRDLFEYQPACLLEIAPWLSDKGVLQGEESWSYGNVQMLADDMAERLTGSAPLSGYRAAESR